MIAEAANDRGCINDQIQLDAAAQPNRNLTDQFDGAGLLVPMILNWAAGILRRRR